MARTDRLDDYQRRHPWLGFPLAVVYKFTEDQGPFLAALITYYGFLSLFPLLLLGVTVLGFVLHSDPHLQQQVIGSALSQFPILGNQIERNVAGFHGSGTALAIGIVGTLYGGLGFAQAAQNAVNRVWAVPRHQRPNPIKSRLRSLGLIGVLGLGVLATTTLAGLTTKAEAFGSSGFGAGLTWLLRAVSLAVNIGLFLLAFRVLTARTVKTRELRLGAILSGVAWQVLQWLGVYFVGSRLKGASELYGLFGLVLGLLAWIYLESVVVVFCTEINVVRRQHLWPRSLLTPFTDNVELTDADRRTYATYASIERFKGFEGVHVTFHGEPAAPATHPPPAASMAGAADHSHPHVHPHPEPDAQAEGTRQSDEPDAARR